MAPDKIWAIFCVIFEKFAVNVEVGKNAPHLKGQRNQDTTKSNYCDLRRDWTIVFIEWLVMNYFSSSYGHF